MSGNEKSPHPCLAGKVFDSYAFSPKHSYIKPKKKLFYPARIENYFLSYPRQKLIAVMTRDITLRPLRLLVGGEYFLTRIFSSSRSTGESNEATGHAYVVEYNIELILLSYPGSRS